MQHSESGGLDAADAEAIAAERAIEAAIGYAPTEPDGPAMAAATRNEMFTRAIARSN